MDFMVTVFWKDGDIRDWWQPCVKSAIVFCGTCMSLDGVVKIEVRERNITGRTVFSFEVIDGKWSISNP